MLWKSRQVKNLVIFFTEICGIGFYWYNKYAWEISEKSLEQQSVSRKSFKI